MTKKIRKKFLYLGTITGLGMLLLSGCGQEEPEGEGDMETGAKAENLLTNVKAGEAEVIDELSPEFLKGNTQFSLDLFKEIATEENAVYSPVPVYTSLGLIANGVKGGAQNEIFESLHIEAMDITEINASYQKLMQDLTAETATNELLLSNSIWYNTSFSPNETFLEKNKTYYEADSFKLDFSDPNAKLTMNDWVDEATKGKIDKMVDEMDPNAVMYLFSTIYLNADWEMPFKNSATYEGDFVTGDKTVTIEKMNGVFDLETLVSAHGEGVVLPFAGEDYSFVAFMPTEEVDLSDYLNNVTIEQAVTLFEEMQTEKVDLHFPKFEVNFENVLNDPLQTLGVQAIFDMNTDQLAPMGTAGGNLYVNKMFQKTYLAVDEKGTEAASAVGTEISETSLLIPEGRMIDFNRPFLYGIIDNETGLPLFIGRMDQPQN